MHPSALQELVTVAHDVLAHHAADSVRLEPQVMRIAGQAYTDPTRFEQEREHIFRNLPLMLAMSCELGEPGAYKTMEVAGTPLLLVRGRDGVARVFLNTCTHRGAVLAQGCGKAARFTCPYHAWTFGAEGQLIGVAQPQIFGEIDKPAFGLKAFPTLETAGMIWAVLNADSTLDIRAFLHGCETKGLPAMSEQIGKDARAYAKGYLAFIHMARPEIAAKIAAANPWLAAASKA